MFRQKQDKKTRKAKIATLRKFINGEDVLADILPNLPGFNRLSLLTDEELRALWLIKESGLEPVTGMVFTHNGVKVPMNVIDSIKVKMQSKIIPGNTNGDDCVFIIPDNKREPKPFDWFADDIKFSDKMPSWVLKESDIDRLTSSITRQEVRVWDETKTYNDPTIEGIHYVNKENVPDVPEHNTPVIDLQPITDSETKSIPEQPKRKQVKELSREQMHRLHLAAKLKEIEKQEQIDITIREKCSVWNKINNSFQ